MLMFLMVNPVLTSLFGLDMKKGRAVPLYVTDVISVLGYCGIETDIDVSPGS
jgi:hypothetical protein